MNSTLDVQAWGNPSDWTQSTARYFFETIAIWSESGYLRVGNGRLFTVFEGSPNPATKTFLTKEEAEFYSDLIPKAWDYINPAQWEAGDTLQSLFFLKWYNDMSAASFLLRNNPQYYTAQDVRDLQAAIVGKKREGVY